MLTAYKFHFPNRMKWAIEKLSLPLCVCVCSSSAPAVLEQVYQISLWSLWGLLGRCLLEVCLCVFFPLSAVCEAQQMLMFWQSSCSQSAGPTSACARVYAQECVCVRVCVWSESRVKQWAACQCVYDLLSTAGITSSAAGFTVAHNTAPLPFVFSFFLAPFIAT